MGDDAPVRQEGGGLVVPSLPQSIARIRRYAVDACRAAGADADPDTLALLVSEVATNAMLHGAGDVHVRVVNDGSALRVEIGDDSPALPVPRDAPDTAEGGRGMALVEALSAQWGVRTDDPGKTVWFELAPA